MRHYFRCAAIAGALAITAISPIAAQQHRIAGPDPAAAFVVLSEHRNTTLPASNFATPRPTHWKRGALIGGGIASAAWVIGSVVTTRSCSLSSCTVATILATPAAFLLGALPGSLIGAQFPKDTTGVP